ncbi:hypothetical protein BASA60_009234 [Batrachochytrium salamandrivorans]|nr:hypothetical protein BASA60_009234 [Batrachochytrium salamandrivorans]
MMVSLSAVLPLALLPALSMAATPVASDYPAVDKLAPANAAWSSAILKGIPNLPLNKAALPNPSWAKDVTTCPNKHQWGLTYDDGPGPYTDNLLGVLAARNVTATFFIVGSRVIQYSDVLLRTYKAGHQIALHTWSHPASTTVSNEQYVAEIVLNARIIKEVIGVTPRFVRVPFGDIDDRVRAILVNLGLTIVAWNVDSNDAGGATDVAAQFQVRANAGSDPIISLEHDLFATTEPQALPALNAILAGSGKYVPMSVAQCLGYASYDEGFWDRVAGKGLPPVNPTSGSAGQTTTTTNGGSSSSTSPSNGGASASSAPNGGTSKQSSSSSRPLEAAKHTAALVAMTALFAGMCMA